ncbi:UDP-N-acetylmuramate--L-alanine ligase [Criibacterium bergeronii]|uniref:UDP-N-acetylmuramate--L-alanine ligase n=1 Tax=Criibacterium bergeronii TaxID=1871336 RepID=A0A371IMT2_9FIRM|nr:UDP-N-acetylmuramate--L-alanine ligase [Criibacterium bergeronii]RDY21803.1 UDP-N-acetylmuramate--L-alanine ligase [Criibacterium bergeronii]
MNVFFIGIGGISMSGLAIICKNLGYTVSGSDKDETPLIHSLINKDIKVYKGHKKEHITKDLDLVVYTAAISKDNEELVEAQNLGLKILERADYLGELMKKYEHSIAIAGTHGKTTTTAMITQIFNASDDKPTALIGGKFNSIGGNVELGDSQVFIAEACEYVDSFLRFYPKIGIITNLEHDHPDYFKDLAQIKQSFRKFATQVKYGGYIIACGDYENVKDALKDLDRKVYYYGFNTDNDFVIKNISYDNDAAPSFSVYQGEKLIGEYKLQVKGEYNVYNAVASICCAYLSNVPTEKIKSAIESFGGVDRRFEYLGEKNGVKVYDDYGHHPTEVRAVLQTAKKVAKNRLIAVFQPHTYSRTKSLYNDFVEALKNADIILLVDIYAAREIDDGTVSSKMLANSINESGKDAHYMPSFDAAKEFLDKNATSGDLVLTLGAGLAYKIGRNYLGLPEEK